MAESLGDVHHSKTIGWPVKLAVMVGLMALVLVTFGRVGSLDFVNYDDPDYVTKNLVVQRGLSWEGVKWAFTSLQATNWHPVTWLSHMLDCSLFGGNPRGHHWMSVVLHGINAALLFLLLTIMTRSIWPSAAAAALFAIHPLRVESVAWVAERKDVLSTMFGLLAVLAYAQWTRQRPSPQIWRRAVNYGLLLACFGLSLMSKPMLVTLPFVLLLLDYWPLRRFGSGDQADRNWIGLFVEKLPLLALSAASCAITVFAQSQGGAMSDLESTPLKVRLANATVAYVMYLWQMIWPTPLAVLYPFRTDLAWMTVIACFLLLAGITVIALMLRRTRPYVLVGWLWYLGTLVPVIGLVQVGQQAHADRYTYVPLIGIVIAIVWTGASCLRNASTSGVRIVAVVAMAAVILALGLRTHDQLRYWRNSVILFEHSIAVAGGTAISCNNLGGALVEQGRHDDGIVWLERALQLNPRHAPAFSNLGMAYANGGHADLAEQNFQTALQIDPANVRANYNLGVLRLQHDQLNEAESLFRTALESAPADHDALVNLGTTLTRLNRPLEAIEWYERACRLAPDSAADRMNLGNTLAMAGRVEEGRAMLQEAAALEPRELAAIMALGQSFLDQGQAEAAAGQFRKAVDLDAKNAAALRGLGAAALRMGHPAEAIPHLREALEIEPDSSEACNDLGLALAQTGRFTDAEAAFRDAVRLQPDNPDAWNNLGKALHELHRPDEALHAFDTAIERKPGLASAHFHRGNALLVVNRLDNALAAYRRAVELEPAFIDARYNLAFTLLRLRNWTDAETAFRETLHWSPNHRGSQRGLIESVVSQPDATPERLDEALQTAMSLTNPPASREAATMLMLAAAQSRNNQMAEAATTLDSARGLAAASPDLLAEIERCAALFAAGKPYEPSPVRNAS